MIEAIDGADAVLLAPSNPLVSIDPLLAVTEVDAAVRRARDRAVAVSPLVGGAALKGPADRLMADLGHEASVAGVARLYRDLAATLVIDDVDGDHAEAVRAEGMEVAVSDTIMRDPAVTDALVRTMLDRVGSPA